MDIEKIFEKYYLNSEDTEIVIFKLKEIGLSQMQSVMVLIDKLKIPLKDADSLVINSKAWNNNYNNITDFRDDFFDFLEDNYK